MADRTVDEVLEAIAAADTVDDSLIVLTTDIKRRLDDALSGVTVPPAVQAKINAIFDTVEAGKAKVAAAVLANTDSAPEA